MGIYTSTQRLSGDRLLLQGPWNLHKLVINIAVVMALKRDRYARMTMYLCAATQKVGVCRGRGFTPSSPSGSSGYVVGHKTYVPVFRTKIKP